MPSIPRTSAVAALAAIFAGGASCSSNEERQQQRSLDARVRCQHAIEHAAGVASADLQRRYGADGDVAVAVVLASRCAHDEWPAEVTACLDATKDGGDMEKCLGQLDAAEQHEVQAAMKAAAERSSRAPAGDAAIDTPVPDGCDAYSAVVRRFADCANVSENERREFGGSFSQLQPSFASTSPETRANLSATCKARTIELTRTFEVLCP